MCLGEAWGTGRLALISKNRKCAVVAFVLIVKLSELSHWAGSDS